MTLNRAQLEQILPHRPPILMLDEVIDVIPRNSGKGVKRFVEGDACFAGHFPGRPILPGVLAIEALAQTAAAVFLSDHLGAGRPQSFGLLGKVNEMAFLQPIVPGDEIEFAVEVERTVGSFAFVKGEATAGGKPCVRGRLTLKIVDER
jgi:3-hydroxyacyl-[acyl-carrier-protein] dehydratase